MSIPTFLLLLAFSMTLPAPATQREMLTLDDSSGLRYAIAVPPGYDGSEDVPLVLALHFGWGEALPPNYSAIFMELLVEPALRDLQAIIVAPLCPGRSWVEPASEEAVLALLDHVRSEYRIDDDRVLVTGFSLGGMGTWYYASHHADQFTAAIPMAGVPVIAMTSESGSESVQRYRFGGDIDWPASLIEMPTYVIHSRDDELIPIAPVENAVAEIKALGGNIEFLAIDAGIGHHQTARYVPYLKSVVPWIREVWRR